MRQTISGLIAAIAVVAAGAAPAMACGDTSCGQVYIPAPVYSGCDTGCGGWAYERLPDPVQQYHPVRQYPVQQYYYVDQGPTFTGPGDFAPNPVYREGGVYGWRGYGYHGYYHHWHHHGFYGYPGHHSIRYGYAPHHHSGYGYHSHTLRRYY
jgi:hypothetical protein